MARAPRRPTLNADDDIARITETRAAGALEESLRLALELSARRPGDVLVAYQTAWAHDVLGREAEAVPYYLRALAAPGLRPEQRQGALLGLGSTYRTIGRYAEARATLQQGVDEFPGYAPLKVFLAMALYNDGEPKMAVQTLLTVLLDRTGGEEITAYREAIALYAEDLDRVWLDGD